MLNARRTSLLFGVLLCVSVLSFPISVKIIVQNTTMGIFSMMSNKKKTQKEKHQLKWKRQKKAIKKASKAPAPIEIEDIDLFSAKQLKNKLKNPRNNIDISNKKKKRILKRLKHQQLTVRQNDEDEEEEDTEMAVVDEGESSIASGSKSLEPSEPSSSTSQQTSTTGKKKRKRGGKKRRNGKASTTEDVEMKTME